MTNEIRLAFKARVEAAAIAFRRASSTVDLADKAMTDAYNQRRSAKDELDAAVDAELEQQQLDKERAYLTVSDRP